MPKPSVSPIQGMILEKLNVGVAQIEYGVLNSTLQYKWLPGGCGNWQVPQFNPPHRQQLPMRRELVWHQHLSAWIWKNSPVIKSWYTAWWIVFRRIHWFNYYTIYTFGMLKSELNDPINSHPKWSGSRNNDHTNLGAWFLACLSSSPVPNTMLVVPWSL